MALTYVAELPLPAMVPSVELSIGVPAISINASFTGAVALNASLSISPPTVAVYLAALIDLQAQLSAAISLGLPSVSFGISVSAGLAAALALQAQLELGFSLLVTLEGLLSAAVGVYAFTYSGVASGMGAALTTELAATWPDGAPTSASCNALIFGAVSSVAQTQIATFLDGLSIGSGLVYTAKLSALAELSLVTNAATSQGELALNAQLEATAAIVLAAEANVAITPPTLAFTADLLVKYAANLTAQLSLAPPSIQAALSATANLAANLSAQFNLIIALGATLTSPGLFFCYKYSGAANALGAAVTTALASTWGDGTTPTSGICLAPILATTDSFSATILAGFFGGI